VRNQSILYRFVCTIHIVTCTLLITSHNHLFCSGVRNAAQRKLFDELGIVADELPVDQFILLGRMLYMAPSDGKWGEHECTYLITFLPSHPGFPVFILFDYLCLLYSTCFKGLSCSCRLYNLSYSVVSVDYLLFMVRDVNLNPNPEEVADVKYVNRDQLKELLRKADAGEDGVKMSPWFRLVVDNFLMGWWDHVEQGTLQGAADMKTIHKL
jgi:isopentenyl-diphosphate Delta-isomerase